MVGTFYVPFSQAQMLEYGKFQGLRGVALDNFMRQNFGEPWKPRDKESVAIDNVVEYIKSVVGLLQ